MNEFKTGIRVKVVETTYPNAVGTGLGIGSTGTVGGILGEGKTTTVFVHIDNMDDPYIFGEWGWAFLPEELEIIHDE